MIFVRYLVRNYFKILLLSLFSFIAMLLVSRLEDIADFATFGAKPAYLVVFILYQIPYVLPIAIPISSLIASIILFRSLSGSHELTALRSSGISLQKIVAPVLFVGIFLSIGSFYITSELATASHLATRKMVYDLSSTNPLLLLQHAKIAKLKKAFIQMDPVRNGEEAKNLVIAVNDPSLKRISLCLAKRVHMEEEKIIAKNVSLISSSEAENKNTFDHLMIENQQFMHATSEQFAALLRKSGWKISNDHLKFNLLRMRIQDLRNQLQAGKNVKSRLRKCYSEIIRRFSVGIASFTFTLMGVSFGIEISRNQSKRGLFLTLMLAFLCLLSFFIGKELDHIIYLAPFLFLMPHFLIVIASMWTLNRINRGFE